MTAPWRIAHDALARHGRARIGGADEATLIALWQDYCIALDNACSVDGCTHKGRVQPWDRISSDARPRCMACGERLVRSQGTDSWRHRSDERADK